MITNNLAEGPGAQLGVGVHNAFAARITERAGFDFLWVAPDLLSEPLGRSGSAEVTADELATVVIEVVAACDTPVYVDGGDTWGGAGSAARIGRLFESAGASAACLWDGDESLDAGAGRIRAVAGVRERMRVIAGIGALAAGRGVAEAVARLTAYAEAGADAVLLRVNAGDEDLLRQVLAEAPVRVPVMVVAEDLPGIPAADLAGLGVAEIVYRDVVRSVIRAQVPRMLGAVRSSGRLATVLDDIASVQDVFDLAARR